MIKIEEILKRETKKGPVHEVPEGIQKTYIEMEEQEFRNTAGMWLYMPALDNLLLIKMHLTYAYNFTASFIRYGFHMFFS